MSNHLHPTWSAETVALAVSILDAGGCTLDVSRALGISYNRARQGLARRGLHRLMPKDAGERAAPKYQDDRDGRDGPLPAGSSVSWGILTRGTVLEGSRYAGI